MWTRERQDGRSVGLIIRSIVGAIDFFLLLYLRTRGCLLGINRSEGSEMVYVMWLLGSDRVLHRRIV